MEIEKRDCAWGCARRINTTWENLQIEKHKSRRRSFRPPDWFVLFDLQIFSGGVYPPSATSRTISFSISNSFWYYPLLLLLLLLTKPAWYQQPIFFKTQRFGWVASAIVKYDLETAVANRPKRSVLKNWLLVLWEEEVIHAVFKIDQIEPLLRSNSRSVQDRPERTSIRRPAATLSNRGSSAPDKGRRPVKPERRRGPVLPDHKGSGSSRCLF